MTEMEPAETVPEDAGTLKSRQRISLPDRESIIGILIYALAGAIVFALLQTLPFPYLVVSMFVFGLSPAIAVVTSVGALRGALAGFLCGYLGVVINGIVFHSVVATATLQAVPYGISGLLVGLFQYDSTNGRSLAKLSVMSVLGYLLTVLTSVAVGLFVEGYATLVALGFVLLPMITLGLPSVALLTPLFVRIWTAVLGRLHRGTSNQP